MHSSSIVVGKVVITAGNTTILMILELFAHDLKNYENLQVLSCSWTSQCGSMIAQVPIVGSDGDHNDEIKLVNNQVQNWCLRGRYRLHWCLISLNSTMKETTKQLCIKSSRCSSRPRSRLMQIVDLFLVPDLEKAVPRPGAHCHAIIGDAQTTDPVVMSSQHT